MDAVDLPEEARDVFKDSVAMLVSHVRMNGLGESRLDPLRNRSQYKDRPIVPGRRRGGTNGNRENPLEFTRRVYPDARQYGLRKSDFLVLDPGLYKALAEWQFYYKQKLPDDLGLTTLSEVIDENIRLCALDSDNPSPSTATPAATAIIRAFNAARSRRHKKKQVASRKKRDNVTGPAIAG